MNYTASQSTFERGDSPSPGAERPPLADSDIGVETTTGHNFAVLNPDFIASERETPLGETNGTQPDRPTDPSGLLGFLYSLIGWRVSPQGKIIVPMDKGNGPLYYQWTVDLMGEVNANNLRVHGNGYYDTDPWRFMCSPSSCDLVEIEDTLTQSGNKWYIVKRFDYYTKPVRVVDDDGVVHWFYKDKEYSPELTPQYFNTRTNRRLTNDIRWITAGGVNSVSWFAAGRERIPMVANQKAAQPAYKVRVYPSLPRMMYVYSRSIIEEGRLVDVGPGSLMMVDAYRFRDSDTDVREQSTGKWFQGDKMLVRAEEPYAASMFDYRCFLSLDGVTPWMGRNCRSPLPEWMRVERK